MELFESVRLKIGEKILAKNYHRTNRKMSFTNIGSIRTIGIVWDASNAGDYSHLTEFIRQMHERKIDTSIIAYFPDKILPDKYSAVKHLTCIRRNELDTFFIPVSDDAVKFINSKIDVLIDINFSRVFPLHYISKLSAARFKIGLAGSDGENRHFDLMMDIRHPVNVSEYLKNIIYYLEMINSGTVN